MSPCAFPRRAPAWLGSGFPVDTPAAILTQVVMVNLTLLFTVFFTLLFGSYACLRGAFFPGILDFILAGLMGLLFFHLRLWRDLHRTAVLAMGAAGLFLLLLLAHGSVLRSGFVWMILYPVATLFVLGAKKGTLAAAAVLGGALVIFLVSRWVPFLPEYPGSLILRIVAVYLILYFFTLIMEVTRTLFFARLEQAHAEQARQAALLESSNREKSALIEELEQNLREVKALRGLVPVCSACKKLRDDDGYWQELGAYLSQNTTTRLTHGICPTCAKALYEEFSGPDADPESPLRPDRN